MNFKQIVSAVNDLSRLQGIVATVGANRYQSVIASDVKLAFVTLQLEEPDWTFMRDSVTFTTSSLKEEYTFQEIMTSASKSYSIETVDLDNVYIDQIQLKYMDYGDYRFKQMTGTTDGINNMFTLKPFAPRSIIIPNVESLKTVSIDFWRTPQYLEKDSDTPILPEEFHYLIVFRALRNVLASYGQQALFSLYADQHDEMELRLRRYQLPKKVRVSKPIYRGRKNRI